MAQPPKQNSKFFKENEKGFLQTIAQSGRGGACLGNSAFGRFRSFLRPPVSLEPGLVQNPLTAPTPNPMESYTYNLF